MRPLLARTGDALTKQTEIDEKRLEDERRQTKPRFILEGKGTTDLERRFVLHNSGGNAYGVTVRYGLLDSEEKLTPEGTIIERMIEQGGALSFSIPNPSSSCVYSVQVDSHSEEDLEGRFKIWWVNFSTPDDPLVSIREIAVGKSGRKIKFSEG